MEMNISEKKCKGGGGGRCDKKTSFVSLSCCLGIIRTLLTAESTLR